MKLIASIAVVFASVAGPAEAAGYLYTLIVVPGSSSLSARALNDAGEVAGDYSVDVGSHIDEHCFIFKNGVVTTIDPPGSTFCLGEGISADGTVVGVFTVGSLRRNDGFVYKNGTFTTFGHTGYQSQMFAISPNGTAIGSSTNDRKMGTRIFESKGDVELNHVTVPFDEGDFYCVNDSGKAGGNYAKPGVAYEGLLYASGKLSPVNVPGGHDALISGINRTGTYVGVYEVKSTDLLSGFVNENGKFARVLDPTQPESRADDINDAGDILADGFSNSPPFGQEVFVIQGGVFGLVPPPSGISSIFAVKINSHKQVLGGYSTPISAAFVATPQ